MLDRAGRVLATVSADPRPSGISSRYAGRTSSSPAAPVPAVHPLLQGLGGSRASNHSSHRPHPAFAARGRSTMSFADDGRRARTLEAPCLLTSMTDRHRVAVTVAG